MPLGVAFALVFLVLARPTWLSLFLSLPLAAGGLGLRAWAAGTLKKKAALATTGPYAHTRNPLYLGSLLMALGFAVASNVWPFAVVLVTFFLFVYRRTIADEERFLRKKFSNFDDYTRAVPRLLPRLGSGSPRKDAEGGFSCAQYVKNREYEAMVGSFVVYLVLGIRILFVR